MNNNYCKHERFGYLLAMGYIVVLLSIIFIWYPIKDKVLFLIGTIIGLLHISYSILFPLTKRMKYFVYVNWFISLLLILHGIGIF